MGYKTATKVKIEPYCEEDREAYEEFLSKRPEATIYHTLLWKKVIDTSFNYKSIYLVTKDTKNKIHAIFPLYCVKTLLGCRLESIPFSIYGGAIGDKEFIKKMIKKAIQLKEELNCNCILVKQPSADLDKEFEKNAFIKHKNRLNQYINIEKPELLWKQIKKSNRNAIRQGLKNGLKLERVKKNPNIEEFYRLDLMTRKRTGFLPPPSIHYKKMWEILHPKGYLEIFNIKHNDQTIASALFLLFNKKIICACAASDTKNLKLRPNNLLLWKVLEWAYENNYETLDLGMTLLDGGGLIFFKNSFNTNDNLYGHQYFPKSVTSFENTVINKLGRISIKLFPIGLMKYAGPYLTSKFG